MKRLILSVPWVLPLLALSAVLAMLAGCGRQANGAAPITTPVGTVVVLVTDHRDAIDDFETAVVTIESIELHRRGAARDVGWTTVEGVAGAVDLTEYTASVYTLGQGSVPAGRYDAVRLQTGPIRGTLAVAAGAAVDVPFAPEAIALDLRVAAAATTELLIDITVNDVRDHPGEGYRAVVASATPRER
jgi:hypothetical protein